MTGRLVIMASGRGSNAAAVLAATADGRLDAEVPGVITDRPEAGVRAVAAEHGIEARVLSPSPGEARSAYDARLGHIVGAMAPTLVVLAGWMRIVSMAFLSRVRAPVINLHPALPGEFPGVGAIERAHAERGAGRTHSGVMVHFVPDEGVDDGPVIAFRRVELRPDDTLEDFATRMQTAEHRLIVQAVGIVLAGGASVGAPDTAQSFFEEAT